MKSGRASAAPGSPARRTDITSIGGALVFLASFGAYLATVAPTITFWDSGELVMGAVSLGNPHPPAYPLFCILGRAASLLPFGSLAYRVNLLSASSGAAAVWLLFRLVREMGGGGNGAALIAGALSLSFGFMPSFWGVSVITEVYTINAFLLTGTAYMLYRYSLDRRAAYLHASAFVAGLALVNHQSVVFFLPAYAAFYLLSDGNYKRPVLILQSLFFFLLGYSAVLYLPVRAAASPAINVGDPKTLDNFAWLIKWPEQVEAAEGLVSNVPQMMAGGKLPLAVLAAAACLAVLYLIFRKERFLALTVLASLTFFAGITALAYGSEAAKKWGLHEKFYIPAFLFLVPVAAWAVFRVTTPAGGASKGKDGRPGGAALGAGIVLTALPVFLFARGYAGADNSKNYFAYDFGQDTLKSVRQDAALFGWGDNAVFPVWYLQGAERYRDDVVYFHTELLTYGWYMDSVRARVRERYGVEYAPEHRDTLLEKNVPGLWGKLQAATPTYLDFSAVYQLKVPWASVRPQGLVYTLPKPWPLPQSGIWDSITARTARDPEANRAFAVEGVLDIYGFQCYRWGSESCYEGLVKDAERAFELCETLAPGTYTSRCAEKGRVEDLRKGGGR